MLASALSWAAAWVAWLVILAVVALPLTYRLLRGLPSRGIAFSPVVGLLLVSYLSWILASVHLLPFGRLSLLGAVGIVAALSALSVVADRAALIRWLRPNLRVAATFALMFIVVFALFFWLRGYYPDVRSTEKPMEIGFLTSTMRAQWMPPHDAWLSGYGINYYYFGYVEAATLGLLSGVRPEVAFNLMSITLPALTFCGASGIVYDLLLRFRRERRKRAHTLHPLPASVVGGLLVAIAGNAFGFARLLADPAAVVQANFWTGIGWNSTRVVKDHIVPGSVAEMITEFPLFSFLLGDIHPHVLALPIVLLAVAVAIGHWLRPVHSSSGGVGFSLRSDQSSLSRLSLVAGRETQAEAYATNFAQAAAKFCPDAGRYVLTALVIGALYPTNAWDLPTFALPILAAVALRRPDRWFIALARVGLLCAGSVLFYLPYYLHFKSLVGNPGDVPAFIQSLEGEPVIGTIIRTFGVVTWPHTSLPQFLAVFAVPLLAASALVVRGCMGRRVTLTMGEQRFILIAGIAIGAVALLTRTAMLLPTGVFVVAGLLALRRPSVGATRGNGAWSVWTPMDRAMVAIAVYGALLPVIPEFVFLRDAFDNRMNTMFKVDYQSWVLLMLAGAYGVVTLVWTATTAARGVVHRTAGPRLAMVAAGVALLALMASVYPAIVPFQRTGHFGQQGADFGGAGTGWQGLDGFRYVSETNPDEYLAMQWLRAHAAPDDRLAEAVGNSYGDAHGWFESRFAAATGVPGILGWYFHEAQWRGGSAQIVTQELPARAADIGTLYGTTNTAEARRILTKYGITWVIVGLTEEDGEGQCSVPFGCPPYAAQGLAKFDTMLHLAFRSGRVSIYRVP
ncbi:MAG: DUF2298 domain-containing protein [Chloroflexota bacterium]|nr:DUF2298 domain-containing protein [Chloroflexota bacterium]